MNSENSSIELEMTDLKASQKQELIKTMERESYSQKKRAKRKAKKEAERAEQERKAQAKREKEFKKM